MRERASELLCLAITTTSAATDSYTATGDEVFVRIVATDGEGKLAMSMPLFIVN